MAIDQRQIADIKSLKPEFVTDPIQAATPPSIGITWNNDDKKYHISLKLPQFVIDGTSTSPPATDDPPTTEDPPVVTITTVDSSKLTLKSYGPFYEDGATTYSINASLINNFDNTIMILDGTTSSDEAGTYTIKIYLRNTALYKWSDSTLSPSDPVTLEWTINPKRELKDCTPAEIVAIVRSGKAASTWSVGDRIPITFENKFKLHSKDSSYIESGTYDAVVLGFDHNITNETPTVSHNMAFAIMYRHDSDQLTCLYSKTLVHQNYANGIYKTASDRRSICNNIYDALPTAWKNIIIDTKKTASYCATSYKVLNETSKVFLPSLYEVDGFGFNMEYSEYDGGKQLQYEGFQHIAVKNVIPVNSDSHNVIVASRSSTDDAATILINYRTDTKYSYYRKTDTSAQSWQTYNYNVVYYDNAYLFSDTDHFTAPDAIGFYDVTVGFIPCFTIG